MPIQLQKGHNQTGSYSSKRIESGIPRLDYILKGGFLEGGVYGIVGTPGTGKTILGNQACFNHIFREQGRCVYLTLMAESHARMLNHLRTLSFFNSDFIPKKLFYLSGYQTLEKEGLIGLLALIRKTMHKQQADLLVIDGLENAYEFPKTYLEFKKFIHDLQASMMLLRCTSLLLSSRQEAGGNHPEVTLLEGYIELSSQLIGPRTVRELTVHKFRGTDYLLGKHEVEITQDGLVIHPRTEIQFARPPENAMEERIGMNFGIDRLDEMLHGGLLSASATTILGVPGAGKTILGLSFLIEGAKQGQRGIYFGFNEPPHRLLEKSKNVGLPLEKYVNEGLIELLWQAPLEHFMDSLAERLLENIRIKKSLRSRLFIDGVTGFQQAAVYPDRMPRFLSALFHQLRTYDVTTLISAELPLFKMELDIVSSEMTSVSDNIILLKYVEVRSRFCRFISIMKIRESDYDNRICEFRISRAGMEVIEPFDNDESLLVGGTQISGKEIKARKAG